MNPITKLYLKTFLFTGIPFGLIMTAFDLAYGNGFSLWRFFFLTFFFGLTMSLILVTFHRNRLKKSRVQVISGENLSVSQERILTSELTKHELIEKLKNDSIFGKMKMTETENGIKNRSDIKILSELR